MGSEVHQGYSNDARAPTVSAMSAIVASSAAASSAHAHGREREGVALCVTTAVCYAAMAIFAKLAYRAGANITTLLAPRFALAAVVLWAIAAHRGVARGVRRRDALLALAAGAVLYAGETELMFQALAHTGVSLSELLVFSYPALVVVGVIALRRERPSLRRFAALGLASLGVTLVLAGGATTAVSSGALALPLGAALLYAIYVLAIQPVGARIPALTLAALVASGAAVTFTAGGLASDSFELSMGTAAWGWTIVIALGTTVLPMAAFLGGVARLGSGRASILAMLEPPLALAAAFLVFGDHLGPAQLLGGLLVLSAAVLLQTRSVRSARRVASAEIAASPTARALGDDAAERAGVGVRAEVGRLPGAGVRRRGDEHAAVAGRQTA